MQLVPAISDAGGPDPKSYKFFWKTGEEEERRNRCLPWRQMRFGRMRTRWSRTRFRPIRPCEEATAGHKASAKPVQPVFENIQFRGFDVWANNQPVMILSAEAHFPRCAGGDRDAGAYSDYAGGAN